MLESTPAIHPEGPEHDALGLFVGGPQFITASDVLAQLIAFQHCPVSASAPENERKQRVTYKGRQKQRLYAPHGRDAFLAQLRPAA